MNNEQIRESIETETGFCKHNNYQIIELTDTNIILKADITENSLNPYKFAHGGFIFGLGDTVMGLLADKQGRKAVTMSSNISYLKPAVGSYLICTGEILRCGKKACFLSSKIYNDKEELVASMTGDYIFIE